jgi:hypothetical protein
MAHCTALCKALKFNSRFVKLLSRLEAILPKDDRRTPAAAPREPYGPPINDAIASGDLQHMKAVAEAARRALYAVEFEAVTADNDGDVRAALTDLDAAITRLDPKTG